MQNFERLVGLRLREKCDFVRCINSVLYCGDYLFQFPDSKKLAILEVKNWASANYSWNKHARTQPEQYKALQQTKAFLIYKSGRDRNSVTLWQFQPAPILLTGKDTLKKVLDTFFSFY